MRFRWQAALSLFFFGLIPLLHCNDGNVDDQETLEEDDSGLNIDMPTSEQMRKLHAIMDANADGKVAMAESLDFAKMIRKDIVRRDVSTILDELDSDRDGRLDLKELLKDLEIWLHEAEEGDKEPQVRKELEIAKFKAADANGDGFLTDEELAPVFYPETHEGVLAIATGHTHRRKDVDGNGQLSPVEFWEGDGIDGSDVAISKEEAADFARLDKDGSGSLSIEELKTWEGGSFHLEDAMQKFFDVADKDNDMHVTADEFANARDVLSGSDAQYHFMEWTEHHEL